jgi:hypothetical protein
MTGSFGASTAGAAGFGVAISGGASAAGTVMMRSRHHTYIRSVQAEMVENATIQVLGKTAEAYTI